LGRMRIASSWNPLNMPLSMTAILISSGLTLTASHVALCHKLPAAEVSNPLI
jgi:heme/copper-type cytochrome/quinol oxidase subunit 3